MTSLERRREARYQRRKAAREQKKKMLYGENDRYDRIISYKELYRAYRKSIRNVGWKESVQRYQMNLLRNLEETHQSLIAHKDISRGFVEFDLMERGRLRHIRSVHFSERVVQRSVCDNALVPMLSRSLIYDNKACLPGGGCEWVMDRLTAHLQQFYRWNGFSNDGYIAIFDFSGYFDSIVHDICFENFGKVFSDQNILWLLETFIRPFGYPQGNTGMKRIRLPKQVVGYTGLSLGLGSEVSQITAVSYPNTLDHYIKQTLRVRWYARYMDDGYMLCKTKEEAEERLAAVIEFAKTLGITINQKKTKIVKIGAGFRFLKCRHRLDENGKVVRRPSRASITRQRRKLKKLSVKVKNGELQIELIVMSHGSWKGYAHQRGGRRSVRNTDKLFRRLFGVPAPRCKFD